MAGRSFSWLIACWSLTALLGPSAGNAQPSGETAIAEVQLANCAWYPAGKGAFHGAAWNGEYLWVASDEGLLRFDGRHFRHVSRVPTTHVAATLDGLVWAGGPDGLFVHSRGEVRQVHQARIDALASNGRQVAFSSGGSVWRGTAPGTVAAISAKPGNLFLTADAGGSIWWGCGTGVCVLRPDGRVEEDPRGVADGLQRREWAVVVPTGPEHLLLGRQGGMFLQHQDKLRRVPGDAAPFQVPVQRPLLAGPDGYIWADDFKRFRNEQVVGRSTTTAPRVGPLTFSYGPAASLWVAAGNRALCQMSRDVWVRAFASSAEGGFAFATVRPSATKGGRIAASTIGVYFEEGELGWKRGPGYFAGDRAFDVIAAANGGYWVIFGMRGLVRVSATGQLLATAHQGTHKGTDFRRFFRDRGGRLWVGSKKNLYRLDENAPRLIPAALPEGSIYPASFASGPDGQEWLGFLGGIARLDPVTGVWKREVAAADLLSPRVGSIAIGRDGAVWVGYRGDYPISRLTRTGRGWHRQDIALGHDGNSRVTSDLLVDHRGWIWRGSSNGLFVADGTHVEPHNWLVIRETHNTPTGEVSTNGLTLDSDGTVLAAMTEGIAHIRAPDSWFKRDTPEPAPRVSSLRLGTHEELWPGASSEFRAADGAAEFDLAVWPDDRPRDPVSVEYRLLPGDESWKTAPEAVARFDEGIRPGKYRLEMRLPGETVVGVYEFRIKGAGLSALTTAWALTLGGSVLGVVALALLWRRRRNREELDHYWSAKTEFVGDAPAMSSHQMAGHVGDVVGGRYQLIRRIGSGGFASVWLAADRESDRRVAVKILHGSSELSGDQRRRFEKEISTLRRLEHPGVVRLLDASVGEEGDVWLAMEYVDGPTLRQIFTSGEWDREQVRRWLLQTGQAMRVVHEAGVIHRDLTPDNIMLRGYGTPDEHAVVIDFGAAAHPWAAGGAPQSTMMMGKPVYLAPEQVVGRASAATDVYTFSATAFELLTGMRFSALEDRSVDGLRRALVGLNEEVVMLIEAGLTFDPEKRPQDIGAFAADLVRMIGAEK